MRKFKRRIKKKNKINMMHCSRGLTHGRSSTNGGHNDNTSIGWCTCATRSGDDTRVRSTFGSSKKMDLLSALPAELGVVILEHVSGADLACVPQVCKAWRGMFQRGSAHEPSLRAALRVRYGLHLPDQVSAGRAYLELRSETCHLCPAKVVLPFVYAASAALGPVPTLFPVCGTCARAQLNSKEFDVLVAVEYAEYAYAQAQTRAEAQSQSHVQAQAQSQPHVQAQAQTATGGGRNPTQAGGNPCNLIDGVLYSSSRRGVRCTRAVDVMQYMAKGQ